MMGLKVCKAIKKKVHQAEIQELCTPLQIGYLEEGAVKSHPRKPYFTKKRWVPSIGEEGILEPWRESEQDEQELCTLPSL